MTLFGLISVMKPRPEQAFDEIMGRMNGSSKTVLVQEMVKGKREFLAGLTRDPQFGPCVLFGLGGSLPKSLKMFLFGLPHSIRKKRLK